MNMRTPFQGICSTSYFYQFLALMATFVTVSESGLPQPPTNIRILQVFARNAVVSWTHPVQHQGGDVQVGYFEMTVLPRYNKSHNSVGKIQQFHLVSYLRPDVRLVTVDKLQPETYYIIYMTAFNDEGASNRSSNVSFLTLEDGDYSEQFLRAFRVGDLAVVLIILVIWCIAVSIFLQKWGSIRIVQPRELRFSFKPKNLETIRVCKRPTDSVIYKTYSRQLSFTMEKREQKLERMNTLRSLEAQKIEEEKKAAKESGARPKKNLQKKDSCTALLRQKQQLEKMEEEDVKVDIQAEL